MLSKKFPFAIYYKSEKELLEYMPSWIVAEIQLGYEIDFRNLRTFVSSGTEKAAR
jgi:hypothetical protein